MRTPTSPPTPVHPDSELVLAIGVMKDEDFDLNPDLGNSEEEMELLPQPPCEVKQETHPAIPSESEPEWDEPEFPPSEETTNGQPERLPVLTFLPSNVMENRSVRLSLAQQSRFVSYVDGELLAVQRRFIQQFNDPERYNLLALLADLNRIVNLVWYSLNPNTPHFFGQDECLIKITGDLQEYLTKLKITSHNVRALLAFMMDLDEKVAYLLDGYHAAGQLVTLTGTARVRLNGICIGLRVIMVSVCEKNAIRGFQDEIGRLFNQVLDRTS